LQIEEVKINDQDVTKSVHFMLKLSLKLAIKGDPLIVKP